MKTLMLSDSEAKTIREALQEFLDDEAEWFKSCIAEENYEDAKKAALNLANTENLLKNLALQI